MPKREDERWAAEKEGMRYCTQHKQYYIADTGCPVCVQEQLALRQSFMERQLRGEIQELGQCPVCQKKSLIWSNETKRPECLNPACIELTPI